MPVQHSAGMRAVIRALLAAAIVAAPAAAQTQDSQANRPTLAVMYFENAAYGPHASDYQNLTKGMAHLLATELRKNESIIVVTREHLQAILEEQHLDTSRAVDQNTAVRVGKILGAQHMLFGGFMIDPKEHVRLDVQAVNVETTQLEHSDQIQGKAEDIMDLMAQLADKLNRGLKLPSRPAGRLGALPASETVKVAEAPLPVDPVPARTAEGTVGVDSAKTLDSGKTANQPAEKTTSAEPAPAQPKPPESRVTDEKPQQRSTVAAQARPVSGAAQWSAVKKMSKGIALVDAKRIDEGMELLKAALEENPNLTAAQASLASLKRNRGT